ncbi:iron chelate uptake ABC transporter family permease subunit [Microlunatus lacustris]
MTTTAQRPAVVAAVPTASPAERARHRRTRLVLGVLAVLLVGAVAAYLLVDLRGSWAYALGLRGRQLSALVVVGVAVGVSSTMFQTVAGSRILTPGVMGFDSLYLLIQTLVVYLFGSTTLLLMGAPVRFVVNVSALTLFGLLLFRWLFRRSSRNLFVLVLVGVVCGALFGSLTSFASRLLSPDDYLTLQDVMFASFNRVDVDLLGITAAVTGAGCLAAARLVRALDVVDLGHDVAVGLGLPYHRVVTLTLVVVTVLVATSTALVGPMMFLGLIVANVARQLLPTSRHAVLLPAAALVGALGTVLGQTVVVHLFAHTTTLSVVVNLVGGLYFLYLLTRTVRL